MKTCGIILIVLGSLGALSFYAMDTAPSGTHNFGLIADRIAGTVFWSAMAIVGSIFYGISVMADARPGAPPRMAQPRPERIRPDNAMDDAAATWAASRERPDTLR